MYNIFFFKRYCLQVQKTLKENIFKRNRHGVLCICNIHIIIPYEMFFLISNSELYKTFRIVLFLLHVMVQNSFCIQLFLCMVLMKREAIVGLQRLTKGITSLWSPYLLWWKNAVDHVVILDKVLTLIRDICLHNIR